MTRAQRSLIRKDMGEVLKQKQTRLPLLIVPLMLGVFLPAFFTVLCLWIPPEEVSAGEMDALMRFMPQWVQSLNPRVLTYYMMMNVLIPMLLLMIPLMSGPVLAAGSFAGEKERKTPETLLYAPISTRQVFTAKVGAGLGLAMLVTWVSGLLAAAIYAVGMFLIMGTFSLPPVAWWIILLVVAPGVALVGLTVTVMVSAKAETANEATQKASLLVLPLVLLAVGQFTGLFFLTPVLLLGIGVVFLAAGLLLMRITAQNFTAEKVLK